MVPGTGNLAPGGHDAVGGGHVRSHGYSVLRALWETARVRAENLGGILATGLVSNLLTLLVRPRVRNDWPEARGHVLVRF
jgi:hypothetical protein